MCCLERLFEARLGLSPKETETTCLDQVMFGATVSKCRLCSSETLGTVKKEVVLSPRPLPLGIPAQEGRRRDLGRGGHVGTHVRAQAQAPAGLAQPPGSC